METQTIPEFPLSYRVRLAVELAGNDYAALAADLGCHENTVHNYIAGRTRPRRPALKIIAEHCGVSLQWLETGEATPTRTVIGRKARRWASEMRNVQVAGFRHPAHQVPGVLVIAP